MRAKQRGTALQATIVILVSLISMLAVAEIGVRVVESSGAFPGFFRLLGNAKPPLDTRSGPGMYYAHHYSAYALKPGYTRSNIERINNLGFRGEDIELQKPDDVYRIVAIGGSTTFAVYLPWEESYPYLLQQELRRRFGTDRIEVINAGLTGSTAAESFHRLATQVLPIEPDMVVIYHAFNDLLPRMFDDYQEDYYHFRRSDPNNPPGLTRFYLYRLALRVLSPGAFHENYNLAGQVWKLDNLPRTDTERVHNFVNSSNDAFRFNMENMIVLLEGKGIDPVLASFAINNFTWHWLDDLPPYMWKAGIDANNEVIADLAAEHDVPLVPFAETPFPAASKRFKTTMFADSIHMSPEGNQLKAEIFADTMAPMIARDLGVDVPEPSIYFEQMLANQQPGDGKD
jgi:lysophospholipase L1-like esterase